MDAEAAVRAGLAVHEKLLEPERLRELERAAGLIVDALRGGGKLLVQGGDEMRLKEMEVV